MTVEHRVARSLAPALANLYENCFYACRYCNRARSAKPMKLRGASLLDPTFQAWADHFELVGDEFHPLPNDADAEYTLFAYDLNDPEKVVRRRVRRELLEDRFSLLSRIGGELSELLELADRARRAGSPVFSKAWAAIVDLRQQALRALRILELFAVVPGDSPTRCRCFPQPELQLPESLKEQCVEV